MSSYWDNCHREKQNLSDLHFLCYTLDMKFFILTGSKQWAKALRDFVYYVFSEVQPEFSFGYFRGSNINPAEWKEAEVLVAEAMNLDESNNPVGWRTAKKSGKKALVFFTLPQPNFKPNEFFICTSILDLKDKIENVIKSSPPLQKDYEKVEKKYPFLTFETKHHH